MRARYRIAIALCLIAAYLSLRLGSPAAAPQASDRTYDEIETRLLPLATRLGKPQAGDWLLSHPEKGQTFPQYLDSTPVRRSQKLTTIYVVLLGEFTPAQRKVLATTQEYLGLAYQSPVKVLHELALDTVPAKHRRRRSDGITEQLQTGYILNQILRKCRPDDALACLCFTASDLYPDDRWNYVFGQATLADRTGVWSIHRFGNPDESDEAYALCLRRMVHTAAHETGHILSIQHCTAFECCLNGSNSLSELDRQPLHLCPVCLRKVLWNVQADPAEYLAGLEKFCVQHNMDDEAKWYAAVQERLK
jgi:archaemetzincin